MSGRAALGNAHHHHHAVRLGREGAEPRARWLSHLAALHQVVEDRGQKVDRHDHVDVGDLAGAAHLQAQRADAEQLAVTVEQRRTAPGRVRRRGEDRLVDEIFPVAGEFLLGDDVGVDMLADTVGERHGVADIGLPGVAELDRRQAERRQRLHQAEAGLLIVGQRMRGNHSAVLVGQPDFLGLGDQIADGEHHAILADEDAIAGPFGAKRLRRKGIGGDDGMDGHDRRERAIEVVGIVLWLGLDRRRNFPVGRLRHSRIPRSGRRHANLQSRPPVARIPAAPSGLVKRIHFQFAMPAPRPRPSIRARLEAARPPRGGVRDSSRTSRRDWPA